MSGHEKHEWAPRSDLGRAWYSCACGAHGRRDLRTGEIKPRRRPTEAELQRNDERAAERLGARSCPVCGSISFECDREHPQYCEFCDEPFWSCACKYVMAQGSH